MDPVTAWRKGYAKMAAEAIESVDEPLEEDVEGLCIHDCPGIASPQCKCHGNVAKDGEW